MSKFVYESWIERNIREYGNCFIGNTKQVKNSDIELVVLKLGQLGLNVQAKTLESKDVIIERC